MRTLVLAASLGLNGILILALLKSQRKVNAIMTANSDALNQLQQDAANESSVVDSAVVVITGLANRLASILTTSGGGEDLTGQIQALRDELNGRAAALAQAVAAGTAAENDSSNFPSSGSSGSTDGSGASGATTGDSTGTTTGSDTGSTTPGESSGSDDGSAQGTTSGSEGDIAPPSAGDSLSTGPDSPPPVETTGDEAVAPDNGESSPPAE